MKRHLASLLILILSAALFAADEHAMLDLAKVQEIAKGATREKFPDAEDVMIDDIISITYQKDGSSVTWDESLKHTDFAVTFELSDDHTYCGVPHLCPDASIGTVSIWVSNGSSAKDAVNTPTPPMVHVAGVFTEYTAFTVFFTVWLESLPHTALAVTFLLSLLHV